MAWNPNVPTVTNRVQDDLNAIRENFQHLDPLAPYVQAILDSRIVEMSSNSNGHYVRWENGLQMCAFIHPDGISVDLESHAYYDWTPPAQFVAVYAVLMVPHTAGGSMGAVSNTYGVLNSNTRAVLRNNADASRIMYPRFIAIGRWK